MAHTTISKVAFIGTGIMGSAIARHILDAGYRLAVYNRTPEKADALVAAGGVRAASLAEAVKHADVVFTMVGNPEDVEDVYLAGDGILANARKGAWLIDLTTSSPDLARDISEAAEVADLHAFDCPVTGGEQGAIDGTLTLIIGAEEGSLPEQIEELLACFSAKRCYFGHAAAKNERQARERAMDILQFTGLYEKRHILSKDMGTPDQKRLEMARALATKPDLLFLDENMAGLNPAETEAAIELIRQINRSGVTIFLIEHIMQAVVSLCESVIVLHHGEKIAEGTPGQVMNDPYVMEVYLGTKGGASHA